MVRKSEALKGRYKHIFGVSGFHAYPYADNGYDDYFSISTSEANILFNTKIEKFDIQKKEVFFNNDWHSYDIIINTISRSFVQTMLW